MSRSLKNWLWSLAALALLASPAQAREFGLELHSSGMRLASQEAMRLTGGQTGYGGLGVRGHVEVVPNLAVGVEWWRASSTSAKTEWQQDLATDAAILDAVYRWPVLAWLQPRVRVGAGLAWHSLELSESGAKFSGSQLTPLVLGTAGFELVVPRQRFQRPGRAGDFTVGASLDLGWQHVFAADWKLDSQRALSPAMTQKSLDFGSAGLTGTLVRVALLLRF